MPDFGTGKDVVLPFPLAKNFIVIFGKGLQLSDGWQASGRSTGGRPMDWGNKGNDCNGGLHQQHRMPGRQSTAGRIWQRHKCRLGRP